MIASIRLMAAACLREIAQILGASAVAFYDIQSVMQLARSGVCVYGIRLTWYAIKNENRHGDEKKKPEHNSNPTTEI